MQRASSDVPSGWYSKFQRARAYSFLFTLLAVPTPPLYQARPKQASQAEMIAAKVDVAYRDQCAALLIPLNQCVFSLFPRYQPSCPSCAGYPSSNRSPPLRLVASHALHFTSGAGTRLCTHLGTAAMSGIHTKNASTSSKFVFDVMVAVCRSIETSQTVRNTNIYVPCQVAEASGGNWQRSGAHALIYNV